jgi:hypothetical protein
MTNRFFDDLERQLTAATTDRARRLRRARNRSVATLCTILVALLAAGGGLAAALTGGAGTTANNPAGPGTHTAPARTVQLDPRTGAPPSATGPCAPLYVRGGLDGVVPSSVVVAVLNGTTVPGLARAVATRLTSDHFRIGTVTNAAAQDAAVTHVYYARRSCATAATLVAQAIDLLHLPARPLTIAPQLRTVAGASADVVVLVGSDQKRTTG